MGDAGADGSWGAPVERKVRAREGRGVDGGALAAGVGRFGGVEGWRVQGYGWESLMLGAELRVCWSGAVMGVPEGVFVGEGLEDVLQAQGVFNSNFLLGP